MIPLTVLALLLRTYWSVDIATMAKNGTAHTHVTVSGYIDYVMKESDGDIHMKIVPVKGALTPFIIAECIPSLPCAKLVAGDHVKLSGISRKDLEHSWWEIHPVEKMELIR